MRYEHIIQGLIDRPRVQIAVVRMLPLNITLVMSIIVAPESVTSFSGPGSFTFAIAVMAMVLMAAWSLVCIMERSTAPVRDLLTFTLFMTSLSALRHASEEGQFLGYSLLFMVGILWLSLSSSAITFIVGTLLSGVFMFAPLLVWPEHYGDQLAALMFVYLGTVIIAASALVAMKLVGSQLDAARRGRQLHDAILEGAGECYVCVDEEGVITEFNTAAEKVFGRSAGEAIGAPLLLILTDMPTYPHESAPDNDGRTVHSIRVGQLVEGVRSDGSRFPLQCFAGTVDLGDDDRRHPLFMHDITTRKRIETLREVHQKVTILISQKPNQRQLVPQALEAIGESGWDGMMLWQRLGDQYVLRGVWTREPLDEPVDAYLKDRALPIDHPYWVDLADRGATSFSAEDLPIDGSVPQELLRLHEMGGRCYGGAMTVGGALALVGWSEDDTVILRDEDSREDYLSSLKLMGGHLAQYMARLRAESQLQSVQAMELNDDVVQALSISFMYRNQGEEKLANEYASKALQAAKRFITRLAVHSGDAQPGSLVRKETLSENDNPSSEGGESV